MLLAVLDTNILVSALLAPNGPCGEVLRQGLAGSYRMAYDVRMLAEYEAVLLRPRFGFPPADVAVLLDGFKAVGELALPNRLRLHLPDEGDRPFVETAFAVRADHLVTGNRRHFPFEPGQRYTVVSPAAFLKLLEAS